MISSHIYKQLINREDIKEELKYIEESISDYITPTGKIYNYYEEYNLYYPRKNHINKHNGYIYSTINTNEGSKSRRVHILVAKAYIPNPNNLNLVEHIDNNKQNPNMSNLKWSNNQNNVNNAIKDGLMKNKIGIESKYSRPIKVTDLYDNLVSVYGSISECGRHIDNIDKTYIIKILPHNGNYKPRNKKFKYVPITKEEYIEVDPKYKNLTLIEKEKKTRSPIVFKAINTLTNEEFISDNQKKFAREHGLEQAKISNSILHNTLYDEWKFEYLNRIKYEEGSGYKQMIDNKENVKVTNVKTNETIIFDTKQKLKDYFNLAGHDILSYVKTNQLIFSEWKVEVIN